MTHLFNAMAPVTAREPGLAGAALSRADVVVQLICDGVHLADETAAARAASPRAVAGSWSPTPWRRPVRATGTTSSAAARVTVRDGVARDADGVIAGSVTTLAGAIREAVRVGRRRARRRSAPRPPAPARLLGADVELGRLRPGDPADLVVLDDALEVTRVLARR